MTAMTVSAFRRIVRRLRSTTLGLLWLVAAGLAACARPGSVLPADFGTEWQPFRWVDARIGTESVPRAAIIVEPTDPALRVNANTPVHLQLDFGFSSTGAFGIPLRLLDTTGTPLATRDRVLAGRIPRLANRDDSTGTAQTFRVGTVGLLYYAVKGLLIDQATQRIGTPRPGQKLPPALEGRMRWSEATEEVGRLSLPLALDRTPLGRVWFDPGSSLVGVLLTAEAWRSVTARRGDEAGLERRLFPMAGDSLVLIGARPKAVLALGGIQVGDVVYMVSHGPAEAYPERFGGGIVGVLGSQAFAKYRLVYVNTRTKKLGVLR